MRARATTSAEGTACCPAGDSFVVGGKGLDGGGGRGGTRGRPRQRDGWRRLDWGGGADRRAARAMGRADQGGPPRDGGEAAAGVGVAAAGPSDGRRVDGRAAAGAGGCAGGTLARWRRSSGSVYSTRGGGVRYRRVGAPTRVHGDGGAGAGEWVPASGSEPPWGHPAWRTRGATGSRGLPRRTVCGRPAGRLGGRRSDGSPQGAYVGHVQYKRHAGWRAGGTRCQPPAHPPSPAPTHSRQRAPVPT